MKYPNNLLGRQAQSADAGHPQAQRVVAAVKAEGRWPDGFGEGNEDPKQAIAELRAELGELRAVQAAEAEKPPAATGRKGAKGVEDKSAASSASSK